MSERENEIQRTNVINKGETKLTPIEVMLDIQDDGTTTARKLYDYLQLSKGQFARWSKTNITENAFAEENKDYKGFDIEVEGNVVQDYKLTASFAKKICMKSHSERGEQARNYFIKVEDILKEKSQQENQLSNKQNAIAINDKIFFAQQFQQMTSVLSQYMLASAKQMEELKEETKSEVKGIVHDSIIIKDQQIEHTAEMIGIRDKNTKYLTSVLKEKLSILTGQKINARNSLYIKIKNKIFRKYKVFTWEQIPIGKINNVFADIDSLEKDDIAS